MSQHPDINKIDTHLAGQSLVERLINIAQICDNAIFTTSLGLEDQYLTWAIANSNKSIEIATLDTGRLFKQTLELIDQTQKQLGISLTRVEPKDDDVTNFVEQYGRDGFYQSLEARKACCFARKVQPLSKILTGRNGWITGLTREQSDGRANVPLAEWSQEYQLIKFNPLADIGTDEMKAEISKSQIPTNTLHTRGYSSIGCEPCTRAIKPGEHPRAGRWWWENNASSECGLHTPS